MISPVKQFLIWLVCLCAVGAMFVLEASGAEAYHTFGNQYFLFERHLMWLTLGAGAFLTAFFLPRRWWEMIAIPAYAISLLLMVLVFVPGFSRPANGAYRWIDLGSWSFQPVEAVKLSMCLFFAYWMSKHQRVLPFLFLTALPCFLLLLQPDLGSMLIVLSIAFGLYFLAGAKWHTLVVIGGIGVVAVTLIILTSPYRLERLQTFLNPESDPLGSSFHIRQIILALGNGGWWGQGLGQSTQRFSYIPEASTDSIFAIIGEELGFVGGSVIILMFMLLIHAGLRITSSVKHDAFGSLLAGGLVIWITAQTLLNLAAVTALTPLTGIPLPFISYGGTSLVTLLFASGILVRIGVQWSNETPRDGRPSHAGARAHRSSARTHHDH
jgi:cell division protein FtsW